MLTPRSCVRLRFGWLPLCLSRAREPTWIAAESAKLSRSRTNQPHSSTWPRLSSRREKTGFRDRVLESSNRARWCAEISIRVHDFHYSKQCVLERGSGQGQSSTTDLFYWSPTGSFSFRLPSPFILPLASALSPHARSRLSPVGTSFDTTFNRQQDRKAV